MQNQILGVDVAQCIENNTCARCKGPANVFNDARSEKEYTITGFCQICQDFVFDHLQREGYERIE